jgi:murein DD-endopeptidase MepM/ murein hydrolase activator NlpD
MALREACSHSLVKLLKTAAAGLLIVALFLAPPLLVAPTLGTARAASSGSLGDKLDVVRSELKQIRASLEKAKVAQQAAQGDITALDQSIDFAQDDVDAAEKAFTGAADKLTVIRGQLDQLTADLDSKQQELEQAKTDLAKEQQVYNDRVVSVYKSGGQVAYLAAFLETESIGDVVSRVDLLSRVVKQDNAVLDQIKTLKGKVEQQKAALEAERAKVVVLENDQQSLTSDLKAAADQKQASLDELQAARAAKQKVLDAAEKQLAAYNKQEDQLQAESDRIAEQLRKAAAGASTQPGKGVLARPVPGSVTSSFGYRIHPIFHVRKLHTGVDLQAAMGDPIHAAAAGTVIWAGWRGGYGKCVIIQHSGNLSTLYGHQSQILVSVGQTVKRGQVIGKVGSTGYSTGPHLHFEVRVNGTPVDPLEYL